MSKVGLNKAGIPTKRKRASKNVNPTQLLNDMVEMASELQPQCNTKKFLKDSPQKMQNSTQNSQLIPFSLKQLKPLNGTKIKTTETMKTSVVVSAKSPLQCLPISSSNGEEVSIFLSHNNSNMQLVNNSLGCSPEDQNSDKENQVFHKQKSDSNKVELFKEENEFKLGKKLSLESKKSSKYCKTNEKDIFSLDLEVAKDNQKTNIQQEKNNKKEIQLMSLSANKTDISKPIETLEATHLELTDLISNYTGIIDELSTQILCCDLNESFSSCDSPVQQKPKKQLKHSNKKNKNEQLSGFTQDQNSQSSSYPCELTFHCEDTQLTSLEFALDQLNRQLDSVRVKHKEQDNAVFAIEKNTQLFRKTKGNQDNLEDLHQQQIFQCKFCTKQFSKSCSLGGHISRVHKGKSNQYKEKQKIREKRETERLRKTHFKQKGIMEQSKYLGEQYQASMAFNNQEEEEEDNEDHIESQEEDMEQSDHVESKQEQEIESIIEVKEECEMESNIQDSVNKNQKLILEQIDGQKDQKYMEVGLTKEAENTNIQVLTKRHNPFLDILPFDSESIKTPSKPRKSKFRRKFSDFSSLIHTN